MRERGGTGRDGYTRWMQTAREGRPAGGSARPAPSPARCAAPTRTRALRHAQPRLPPRSGPHPPSIKPPRPRPCPSRRGPRGRPAGSAPSPAPPVAAASSPSHRAACCGAMGACCRPTPGWGRRAHQRGRCLSPNRARRASPPLRRPVWTPGPAGCAAGWCRRAGSAGRAGQSAPAAGSRREPDARVAAEQRWRRGRRRSAGRGAGGERRGGHGEAAGAASLNPSRCGTCRCRRLRGCAGRLRGLCGRLAEAEVRPRLYATGGPVPGWGGAGVGGGPGTSTLRRGASALTKGGGQAAETGSMRRWNPGAARRRMERLACSRASPGRARRRARHLAVRRKTSPRACSQVRDPSVMPGGLDSTTFEGHWKP